MFAAAMVAGAVNSVAGGGTLLTFPTLIALGIDPKVANATSTVALWPGALSSLWGYRDEMTGSRPWLLRFGLASLAGGLIGARLLVRTKPGVFEALVPYLILFASVLFMIQEPISRWLRRRRAAEAAGGGEGARGRGGESEPRPSGNESATSLPDGRGSASGHSALAPPPPHPLAPSSRSLGAGLLFQFLVAVYGGYFGAGIGILMLAALGLMGMERIHQMNGVKNFAALCINGVAAATFIVGGLVDWPLALLMAVGAILGGYAGAGTARRLGPQVVRRLIIAIGLGIGLAMLLRTR